VGLLDAKPEQPESKWKILAISGAAALVILGIVLWLSLRYAPEKRVIDRFMDSVVAGNLQQAYQIWHPTSTYPFSAFVSDWGPDGYYGPILSYQIKSAAEPENGGSGVIVTVEVSPYSPYPSDNDPKSGRTKEVQIWVERSDKSLSFPP